MDQPLLRQRFNASDFVVHESRRLPGLGRQLDVIESEEFLAFRLDEECRVRDLAMKLFVDFVEDSPVAVQQAPPPVPGIGRSKRTGMTRRVCGVKSHVRALAPRSLKTDRQRGENQIRRTEICWYKGTLEA